MSDKRPTPSVASPELYKAVARVDALIRESNLDPQLMELVKIRASQINGCGFCLSMHAQAARKAGETCQRLDVLAGWRETDLFTPAERAALAWTETLTRISETGPTNLEYENLTKHFDEKDIVDLTILVGLINLFNRLAISMQYKVG